MSVPRSRIAPRLTNRRRALRVVYALAALAFLALAALHYDRATGFTRYLCFGDRHEATWLAPIVAAHPYVFIDSDGYDGQFYAQMAVDPLLADAQLKAALDTPDYRARRIGLPWLAWLAGVGQAPWVLQAYALLNIVAWLALAGLLLRWLPPSNATALLAWLGCLFGVGVMMSVERALTDVPAALAIAATIALAERGRRIGAGAAFALAVLTRETSALALGGLSASREQVGAKPGTAVLAAAALLPFALWAAYVHLRFAGPGGMTGFNFALPFTAIWRSASAIWQSAPQRGWPAAITLLLTMGGLCVQGLTLLASARRDWRTRWWRAGAPFALLLTVLGPGVWLDPAAAARAVIPMSLAFNILLPRGRWWSVPLCLLGNLPVLRSLIYLPLPL